MRMSREQGMTRPGRGYNVASDICFVDQNGWSFALERDFSENPPEPGARTRRVDLGKESVSRLLIAGCWDAYLPISILDLRNSCLLRASHPCFDLEA